MLLPVIGAALFGFFNIRIGCYECWYDCMYMQKTKMNVRYT